MNKYKLAVDFLEDYVNSTSAIYDKNLKLEGFESKLQFAIKILKEEPNYGQAIN